MTKVLVGILLAVLVIEFTIRPRFDKTKEGNLLLWYGIEKRKFLKIY